jgi:hypothetical protein
MHSVLHPEQFVVFCDGLSRYRKGLFRSTPLNSQKMRAIIFKVGIKITNPSALVQMVTGDS